jgi:glycosyltransferase involved in cell wall biosynthesis
MVSGVIWVGPVYNLGGYADAARSYIRGVASTGFPIKVTNIGRVFDGLSSEDIKFLRDLENTDVGSSAVGVVQFLPDLYPTIRFTNVIKRIGVTLFETDRIPYHWRYLCNTMDELWVPTRFNSTTFSQSGVNADKIKIIPYSVDIKAYSPRGVEYRYGIAGLRQFSFLYIFAFGWRKGLDLLLDAYCGEFTSEDDISLVLKVSGAVTGSQQHSESPRHYVERYIRERFQSQGSPPHVVIIDEVMDEETLRRLINTCSVYFSTERANGWGMPCMHAMAMRKPASAINWGGNTEFMLPENSFLIPTSGNLVDVDSRMLLEEGGELYRHHRWMDVSLGDVQKMMRYIIRHPEEVKAKAMLGYEYVRSNLSEEIVGKRIVAHLSSLESSEYRWSGLQSEVQFIRPSWFTRLRIRAAKEIGRRV